MTELGTGNVFSSILLRQMYTYKTHAVEIKWLIVIISFSPYDRTLNF